MRGTENSSTTLFVATFSRCPCWSSSGCHRILFLSPTSVTGNNIWRKGFRERKRKKRERGMIEFEQMNIKETWANLMGLAVFKLCGLLLFYPSPYIWIHTSTLNSSFIFNFYKILDFCITFLSCIKLSCK